MCVFSWHSSWGFSVRVSSTLVWRPPFAADSEWNSNCLPQQWSSSILNAQKNMLKTQSEKEGILSTYWNKATNLTLMRKSFHIWAFDSILPEFQLGIRLRISLPENMFRFLPGWSKMSEKRGHWYVVGLRLFKTACDHMSRPAWAHSAPVLSRWLPQLQRDLQTIQSLMLCWLWTKLIGISYGSCEENKIKRQFNGPPFTHWLVEPEGEVHKGWDSSFKLINMSKPSKIKGIYVQSMKKGFNNQFQMGSLFHHISQPFNHLYITPDYLWTSHKALCDFMSSKHDPVLNVDGPPTNGTAPIPCASCRGTRYHEAVFSEYTLTDL